MADPQPISQTSETRQPLDPNVQGKNFPHAKPPDLESLRPAGQSGLGFREQHVAALTTVLHRCFLQDDYIRAGRAWGILLRIKVQSQSVNLRTHDRWGRTNDSWGLGAEILCRRYSQLTEISSRQKGSSSFDDGAIKQGLPNPMHWFSQEGFNEARDYYERLILQYPHRKAFPSMANAIDFYPAMFGLWIFSEQKQYESSLQALRELEIDTEIEQSPRKVECNDERDLASSLELKDDPQPAEVHRAYLHRAREIQTRLDELLMSPPFSDNARLCKLQTMVTRWVEHLSSIASPQEFEASLTGSENGSRDSEAGT